MWWHIMVMVATGMLVGAQDFNLRDESDYVDNADEDEPTTKSIWVSDIVSTEGGKGTVDIQGEIEKLLGQPIIQYEEPDPTIAEHSPESTASPTVGPEKPIGPSSVESDILRSETSDPQDIRLSRFKTRETASQDTALSILKTNRLKPTRVHRTKEVIYSVQVPQWDDSYPQVGQKFRPGVIESLVNAHEVIRYETARLPLPEITRTTYEPTRTPHGDPSRTFGHPTRSYDGLNQTAFNEGGFRYRTTQTYEDSLNVLPLIPNGRRYLVTIPEILSNSTTRRPRPTPVTRPLTTSLYDFTRRTRRHPNCTDSYYECLFMCFDRKGYRLNCPWDTKPPRPEPARMNFTGLMWAIQREWRMTDYDTSNLFASWHARLLDKGYRACRTFTPTTTTLKKLYPIYYDDVLSPKTGRIIAKCWVCGLLDSGIPDNSNCADNFGNSGITIALAEKNSYRKYCRYMEEIPLWFNRSDPFSIFGPWTGGCSYRWLDLSGLYTQRTCRSVTTPATGQHFLSKRMAGLELALREVREGCVVSPMATLVPFSRAVSLFARFHVCVCRGNFCNQASQKEPSLVQLILLCAVSLIRRLE